MESRWEDPPEYSGGGGVQLAMPPVTPIVKMLLIGNFSLWVLFFLLDYFGDTVIRVTLDTFALSPDVWRSWFPLVPLWQLVTYGFLHGGPMHLIGNMLFLYFLGTMLEGILGSRRFAVIYFAGIVFAGVCQLIVSLAVGQSAPVLGASGAVLTIVVAMATLRPRQRIIFILFPITLKTLAIMYVALDIYGVLMELKGAQSNVANTAHLAGALLGFLAVRKGWIWKDPIEGVQGWRKERDGERQIADQEYLDELLAKINRDGIGSLSSRERAFLKRVSKR